MYIAEFLYFNILNYVFLYICFILFTVNSDYQTAIDLAHINKHLNIILSHTILINSGSQGKCSNHRNNHTDNVGLVLYVVNGLKLRLFTQVFHAPFMVSFFNSD